MTMGPGLALALMLLMASAPPAAAPRRSLVVAAAANLKLAAEDLKKGFEAEHPDVDVSLSYGASGTFFAQIRNGTPMDLFLSADREYPDQVVAAGLAAASDERVYAFGKLVVWLPPGSKLDVETRGLAVLTDPAVKRIAIANPAVAPFGRATEAALRAAGVLEAVRDKLVLGSSVGHAAQLAATGGADVAFLPRSLTLWPELSAGRVIPVAEALHPHIEQAGVVLRHARDPALARAFLAFVTGEKGRAILARNGYGLP